MTSRAALMVEMALKKQPRHNSSIGTSSGADSDDEPLSRLLKKKVVEKKYCDQGQDSDKSLREVLVTQDEKTVKSKDLKKMSQLSSQSRDTSYLQENNTFDGLTELLVFNELEVESAAENVVHEDEEILLDVPIDETFTVAPDLLKNMQSQNIIVITSEEAIGNNSISVSNISNFSQTEYHSDDMIGEIISENKENIQHNKQLLAEVPIGHEKRKWNSKREETKSKRLKGDKYIGYTRSKEGKVQHNVDREERLMKNRCSHQTPQKQTARTLLCGEVSEDMRKTIFKDFWNMESWTERNSFIKGLVSTTEIRRRRKNTHKTECRKKQSHDCFLPLETGRKVFVCRKMLLNTFGLGRNAFERWTANILQSNSIEPNTSDPCNGNDVSLNDVSKSKRSLNAAKCMKREAVQWLYDLPKVPSHYCRSSSNKMYLESVFRSTLHVYKEYVNYCLEKNTKPICRTLFIKLLKSENIAIHKPRKDQCDLCCSWKAGNINENEYNTHIRKKNEAEIAKRNAKESLSDEKLVVTMDLQSVLLAPKLEASAVYYKQKLQIHNFTVYALNNKRVDLYVWHESNGGVSSNEFTTCIVDYINTTKNQQNYKHITLISDRCGYQNRNKVLASALQKLAQDLDITIELILERGHTMMEADSVHSSLEAYFKPPIYAPSDYVTRMRQARDHQPYHIHNLDYSFFRNYEQVEGNLTTIKPSKEAKVTDIRGLLFKLNHGDEWVEFIKPRKSRNSAQPKKVSAVAEQLFFHPIKITKQKYAHLQELKKVVERDYHPFYDSLPHN